MEEAYVVKELGKLRKNCLCIVKSRDTIRVAKRSSVSYHGEQMVPLMNMGEGDKSGVKDLKKWTATLRRLHHVASRSGGLG